jgi:DNA polymerase alpha subunit A
MRTHHQRFQENEGKQDNRIYDEMDESQYKLLVTRRLKEEDFVIDDDGQGYADLVEEEDYDSDFADDDPRDSNSMHSGKGHRHL